MNNTQRNRDGDIEFKVSAQLGVINSYSTGWRKELNIISWNGGPYKFDIRDWDEKHEHMSRGVTLHEEEARTLMGLLEQKFSTEQRKGGRKVKGTWPAEEEPESEAVAVEEPEDEPVDEADEESAEEPVYEE